MRESYSGPVVVGPFRDALKRIAEAQQEADRFADTKITAIEELHAQRDASIHMAKRAMEQLVSAGWPQFDAWFWMNAELVLTWTRPGIVAYVFVEESGIRVRMERPTPDAFDIAVDQKFIDPRVLHAFALSWTPSVCYATIPQGSPL